MTSKYQYKAINSEGQIVEASIEKDSEIEVIAVLKELSLSPLSIELSKQSTGNKHRVSKRRITRKDITYFTNQLSALLQAKLPIIRALESIRGQSNNENMKDMLSDITQKIKEGSTFSDALSAYPKYFSDLYRNMVYAGEVGGLLEQALLQISEMLERDEALQGKIKGALAYPAIMFIVMIISVVVMMTFVVPKFMKVFKDMGGALPVPTRILISISHFFEHYWWIMGLLIGAAVFGFRQFLRSEQGRYAFDRFKLSIPLIGNLYKQLVLARFSLTLGTLTESGVMLLNSLEAAKGATGDSYISDIISNIAKEIREGKPLSTSLKSYDTVFPELIISMVGIGEESGNLGKSLENVGKYYQKEADELINTATKLIEPVIILSVGLVVGAIMMAMLLPIFDMQSMLK